MVGYGSHLHGHEKALACPAERSRESGITESQIAAHARRDTGISPQGGWRRRWPGGTKPGVAARRLGASRGTVNDEPPQARRMGSVSAIVTVRAHRTGADVNTCSLRRAAAVSSISVRGIHQGL